MGVAALLVLLLAYPGSCAELEGRRLAVHVLGRLGYGARPGEAERLAREGVDAWIARQLAPESIVDPACAAVTARYPSQGMGPAELFEEYPQPKQARLLGMFDREAKPQRIIEEAAAAKLERAAVCQAQLAEVMTDFWFNHFNVDARKGPLKWLFTSYERDTIRPRAFGRFRDLLGAVAHSPAMLVYLDNAQSTVDARYAPREDLVALGRMEERMAEKGGKRAKLGLNENYARELLELHTVGVGGGYSQTDVTELARVLTGWTLVRPNAKKGVVGFQFRPRMHDAGEKTVLGRRFGPDGGQREGELALDMLARHPATARFIALKLCRRFVSDEPPAALVERLAAKFTAADGDVRVVLAALFASPEFRSEAAFRAKVKTPYEFAVSLLRATRAELRDPLQAARALVRLGQPPYLCEPPTGWPDRADAWISAGGLLERLRAAAAVTRGGPNAPAAADAAVVAPRAADARASVDALAAALLGGELSERTRKTLEDRLDDPEIRRGRLDDAPRPADERLLAALVLGSPEFQRR
ncbi:MAG: DUF1800 domain-containing protein [Elusimicrobia bacterium]|nr:DUF1800 domain-containing protein [Elusimicrobiota bacterium]